jgi:hypothetical protein
MNKKDTKIVKRIRNDQELLIEQLKKTPIVQITCEKTSIGRATYYRWLEKYPNFAKRANEAIKEGEALVSDMAESQLLAAIRDGNLRAIVFWLRNHHKNYTNRIEITSNNNNDEELSPDQQKLIEKALSVLKEDAYKKEE